MSALIKSVDALACRPLGQSSKQPSAEAHLVVVPEHEREISQLREQLATLQADLDLRVAAASRDGIAQGRQLAIEEFEHGRSETLDRLEMSCNKALEHFSNSVVSIEKLATLIAQAVLDQMLLGDSRYPGIARDVIVARVKEIERSSIVRMLVSSVDFPEQCELDQIAELCGVGRSLVEQAADLESGECRIELTLGVLDVGVRQQWDKLNRLLRSNLRPGD